MNDTPLSWRMFRALCIVQLLLTAIPLVGYVVSLFRGRSIFFDLFNVTSYLLVFVFVYQGLVIMNYNYPDNPLSVGQKRRFNIFFLANFLLIAFMFSKVVDTWWIVGTISVASKLNWSVASWLLGWFIISLLSFIFHLLFLYGMYSLRKLIYTNTVTNWVNQFDQTEP